jgi:SAM-dependent methyltransferase
MISVISGTPTVYAQDLAIKKAFELAKLKPRQTVLDLGCGNARSLIIAAKKFRAKGIGVEISPFYFLLAKLNILIKGEDKNIKIYYGNILNQEKLVQEADLVYLYLFEELLEKLEPILFKTLQQEATIVSVAFKFKRHKPYLTSQNPRINLYKI